MSRRYEAPGSTQSWLRSTNRRPGPPRPFLVMPIENVLMAGLSIADTEDPGLPEGHVRPEGETNRGVLPDVELVVVAALAIGQPIDAPLGPVGADAALRPEAAVGAAEVLGRDVRPPDGGTEAGAQR